MASRVKAGRSAGRPRRIGHIPRHIQALVTEVSASASKPAPGRCLLSAGRLAAPRRCHRCCRDSTLNRGSQDVPGALRPGAALQFMWQLRMRCGGGCLLRLTDHQLPTPRGQPMNRSRHRSSLRRRGGAAATLAACVLASSAPRPGPDGQRAGGRSEFRGHQEVLRGMARARCCGDPRRAPAGHRGRLQQLRQAGHSPDGHRKANGGASLSGPMAVIDAAVCKSAARDGSGIDDPKTRVAIDTISKDARTRCAGSASS